LYIQKSTGHGRLLTPFPRPLPFPKTAGTANRLQRARGNFARPAIKRKDSTRRNELPCAARRVSMKPMIAKRVIPCLDVHDGQVTRGVQFGKAEAALPIHR